MLQRLPVRYCPVNLHTRLSSNLFSKVEIEGQKDENTVLEPIRGRENRKLMAPEYISPQYQKSKTLWKKMVRQDCLRRRNQIDLPEFYPGSIVAVTYADKYAANKTLRFVGRVLTVQGFGTNHRFLVRNIVDDVAVNIQFDLYSPLIQSIVVLRLEKWMDSNLRYLMQCDPYYCKIPFDMMQDIIPAPDVPIERFQGKVPEKDLEYESGPPGPGKKWFPGQNKRGYKQKVKNAEQKWPEIHNLFWEEHLIQEDLTHAGYKRREKSWHQFDIMQHHNYDQEHDEIIKEMEQNAKQIKHVTKSVGRPKVDYSKLEKVWIDNYSVHSCEVLPEAHQPI